MKRLLATLGLLASSAAGAHSASDAYLTLTADARGGTVIHGQWDIALRDLDFVLTLDDDGDGKVTWGELERHQAAIERYAYGRIAFSGGSGNRCWVKPVSQLVDEHADGAYAVLMFDVLCRHAPRTLTMDYGIFFPIDPSHRGIFVMHSGNNVTTALLSPQNARIHLTP